jgi:type I restriction enzyme M protein
MAKSRSNNGKTITTQAAMDKAVKGICDILRRDKAKGARLYVPELTWMFFLRFLDILEQQEEVKTQAISKTFQEAIPAPYRWRDWAAPFDKEAVVTVGSESQSLGWKRNELTETKAELNGFLAFVNGELFPFLIGPKEKPGATPKHKVIGEIFANKEKTIVASQTNLLDVLDRVHSLTSGTIADQHMFPISQAFEGLLPSLGEKKNDGGQFFTPREVIRIIVKVVNPCLDKTVYDPCCGTGGFLIEAYKQLLRQNPTATQIQELKTETLWGREDAMEAIPIALANMILHEIDLPRIWHGNTLTGTPTYADLFIGAPALFDYVFTNPPFGSKEGKDARAQFPFKCGKAQILFRQHIVESLADGGTCGMVIDEGVLFHTKTAAYRQTKRKLLDECDLWCVISLPQGVFVNAGAGVKTNLIFFTKGKATRLGPKKTALGNLPEDESKFPVATWFKQLLAQGVQSFILNSQLIRKASPPGQLRGFKPDGSNLAWVVNDFRKKTPSQFEEWIRHVRTALPDILDIDVVVREDDKHAYLILQYQGGLRVPSWMTSDGTLRLLALTLPAYLPWFQGIYLIEEPENGIHPGAAETVYLSLSSTYNAQILLATHSPIILSQAEANKVLCFKKTASGATDIIVGNKHPRLKDWQGQPNLSVLFASGVLG